MSTGRGSVIFNVFQHERNLFADNLKKRGFCYTIKADACDSNIIQFVVYVSVSVSINMDMGHAILPA
jgi:hypothetical protein